MKLLERIKTPKFFWSILLIGVITCIILLILARKAILITSTDKYCQSCHIHPHADDSWKKSTHFYNKSGVVVHCVECHLPPKDENNHLIEKAKTGIRDLYGYYFKDSASFNWEAKRELSHAVKIVYNKSCLKCHQNIFTKGLSTDGGVAHVYYDENVEKLDLQCINCHLDAGHYNPNYTHGKMTGIPTAKAAQVYAEPARITSFENYTEKIPQTSVSFNMIAIDGGSFKMGSPENEPYRKEDEGPIRNVTIAPFFIGETEVSWDEYWAFVSATISEVGKDPDKVMMHNASNLDAISGPTPPWGAPDQGWGLGDRPAITMSHYAARIYCQWLSKVTGKKYRLPKEAEWEFACRGGTETPYFFEGDPKKFSKQSLRGKIFGADTTLINRYMVYSLNSSGKTQDPAFIKPNPLGVKNMAGNVLEFCSDWYAEDTYSKSGSDIDNPKGPETGSEYVVRGGNYASDAKDLRSASRGKTDSYEWLKTDPQQPKSIWWFTDIKGIGFRIVCEPDSTLLNTSD